MAPLQQSGSNLANIARYIEAINRDPRSTAFVPLAEIYRQMGLLDDALEVANRGVANVPGFASGFIVLGRILAQRGLLTESSQAFSKAVELDPESLQALKGLAKVLGLKGERERAREILARATALHPQDTGPATLQPAAAAGPSAPPIIPENPVPQTIVTSSPLPSAVSAPAIPGEDEGEPIQTATIAEIYVQQGLLKKALKVYRDLLLAEPDNKGLAVRYRQLGSQLAGEAGSPEPLTESPSEAVPPQEQLSADAGGEEPASTEVVNRLDRWLAAIQDRRAHVR